MTRDEAYSFLRTHQPLPSDEHLSRELIESYDEVRKLFLVNPDVESLPLLLGSFGDGSGFGVYQLVEDVIAKLPREEIIPHLERALGSPHKGVRYWSTQFAGRFPDPRLVQSLAKILGESDYDLRYAAMTALEQIGNRSALALLKERLELEVEEDLRDLMVEILTNHGAGS
jgi:HEAT repeat protein